MRFEFATATRIVFGPGVIAELPRIALAWGRRAFVVTGKDRIRRAGIIADLEGAGFHCTLFGVDGEPTVDLAVAGGAAAHAAGANVVIAIGGGSVVDAGKAIAAFATNGGDPLEHLEVIGRGRPLRGTTACSCRAIPPPQPIELNSVSTKCVQKSCIKSCCPRSIAPSIQANVGIRK